MRAPVPLVVLLATVPMAAPTGCGLDTYGLGVPSMAATSTVTPASAERPPDDIEPEVGRWLRAPGRRRSSPRGGR